MANPLQLLIGTNSLRNSIARQFALLPADIERIQTRTDVLKRSATAAVTSPIGLAATAVAGFAAGRALLRQHRKHESDDIAAPAPSTPWWDLLLPIGALWIRHFVLARIRQSSEQ